MGKIQILYVPEVADDLAEARDWYETRSDGLGTEFMRMAYAEFAELQEFPAKDEVVYGSFRRALLSRFPYSTYYCCVDDVITVYGLFHAARDPRWIVGVLGAR